MTEAWKSNPHYFCEVCRVWLNDNPSARATHERGLKHQENVAKKLRDMRKKADTDKKNEALAVASMGDIEAKARRQYEQDLKDSSREKEELTGNWEKEESSGYMYNAHHRYYFDSSSGMYYGGEPAAWTLTPDIPPEAYYKPEPEAKVPLASTSGRPAAAKTTTLRSGMRVHNHPMSNIGGYQMPTIGRIGGAKGLGAAQATSAPSAGKRQREGTTSGKAGGKALSKEEQEALARREAARARVQQRTMQAFGLS